MSPFLLNPHWFTVSYRVVIVENQTPAFSTYPIDGTGFGTEYTFTAGSSAANAGQIGVTPGASILGVSSSSWQNYWLWNGSEYGTRQAGNGWVTGLVRDHAFNPARTYVFQAHDGSPYATAQDWSESTGQGTKIANPATLPITNGKRIASDGTQVVVASAAGKRIEGWPFTTSWGTKYADIVGAPSSGDPISGLVISDGTLFASSTATPYFYAWPISGSGFGTKYSDPGTGVGGANYGVAYVSGVAFGCAEPNLVAYPFSAGWGTKYSAPATDPYGGGYVAALPNAVVKDNTASPYINGWAWTSGSGFGTKFSNPAALPAAGGKGIGIA